MYVHQQSLDDEAVQILRREAGAYLRGLCEARGITQREMAERLGTKFWIIVSEVETGRGRIPPDHVRLWAQAYGIDARDFAIMIMRFYDPETFAILYDRDPEIRDGTAYPDLAAALDVDEVTAVPRAGERATSQVLTVA